MRRRRKSLLGLSELLEESKNLEALPVSSVVSVKPTVTFLSLLLPAPGDQSHVISSQGANVEHLLCVGSCGSEEATRRGLGMCVCLCVCVCVCVCTHACLKWGGGSLQSFAIITALEAAGNLTPPRNPCGGNDYFNMVGQRLVLHEHLLCVKGHLKYFPHVNS